MPSKKKIEEKIENIAEEPAKTLATSDELVEEEKLEEVKSPKQEETKSKTAKKAKKEPKYAVGSIVFVSKDADADLNGFKLFPQYKKYTYTVEAYDENTEVYSLRRLNLSLRLKEDLILAPHEKSGSALMQKQY